MRRPLLALLLVTAGVSSSPAAENDRLPEFRAPERPGGIVPQVPSAGIFEALELGEAQYYSGELDAAAESLERAFARLEDHPEWLPAAAEHRIAVYKRLLALYRLRVERGGEGRDLADWLARHLTDQDPSVLSVPPMIEAALSGWRDAVRARSALLSVEVRDEADWEVYVDGRRLGVAPLRGIELPAGLHAVDGAFSDLRHGGGQKRDPDRQQLVQRRLGAALCIGRHRHRAIQEPRDVPGEHARDVFGLDPAGRLLTRCSQLQDILVGKPHPRVRDQRLPHHDGSLGDVDGHDIEALSLRIEGDRSAAEEAVE